MRTSSDPRTAATTSRNEIATLSSEGKSPTQRNSRPPTRAPIRPTAKFRTRPNPLRSQVIKSPAMLPPSSPTTIQTMN